MHNIDEKLDDLESLLSLFESKLDSLPEEMLQDIPDA